MKAKQEKGYWVLQITVLRWGFADILFLAVKPQYYEDVLAEIKDALSDRQIIVSIAPGKTLDWIGERLGEKRKISADHAKHACTCRRGNDRGVQKPECGGSGDGNRAEDSQKFR